MSDPGYIYIMAADGVFEGIYKIGYSINPASRLRKITLMPFSVRLLHIVACDNMVLVEGILHTHLVNFRVKGEWFNLDSHTLDELLKCKTQGDIIQMTDNKKVIPSVEKPVPQVSGPINWQLVESKMKERNIKDVNQLMNGVSARYTWRKRKGKVAHEESTVNRIADYLDCDPLDIVISVRIESDNDDSDNAN